MKSVKAYKVFNSDWTCRDYDFKIKNGSAVGSTHSSKDTPILCSSGFHACASAAKCFDYYSFDAKNKVAEVELSGIIVGDQNDKYCANTIKIVRELSWSEVLSLVNAGIANTGRNNSGDQNSGNWNSGDQNSGNRNSGDRNSGDRNSGNWNSGDRNSGNRNSGDRNSGNRNSGDRNSGDRNSGDQNSGNRNSGDQNSGNWNSGNQNSGNLNTDKPLTRIFNKETMVADISFPDYFYFDLTRWVDWNEMTEDEKKNNPSGYITNGYLKVYGYKEAWQLSFDRASESDRKKTESLPNFDAELFYEITGINYFITSK